MQWLHELETSLPSETYAERVAAGRARDLNATLAELLGSV